MSGLRPLKWGLIVLALICFLIWASGMTRLSSSTKSLDRRFEPDGSFKGRIVVKIIERKTGPEKNLEFLIDLDRGVISASPSPQFSGPLSQGGRIDDCRGTVEVPAPSRELVATCVIGGGTKDSAGYVVRILKHGSNEQVRQWSVDQGWDVCGLVWSADSRSIAALLEKERTDLGPVGLLSAASGHPIPLETFKVTVYLIQSGRELKLPVIREDSPSGWARIDWIQ